MRSATVKLVHTSFHSQANSTIHSRCSNFTEYNIAVIVKKKTLFCSVTSERVLQLLHPSRLQPQKDREHLTALAWLATALQQLVSRSYSTRGVHVQMIARMSLDLRLRFLRPSTRLQTGASTDAFLHVAAFYIHAHIHVLQPPRYCSQESLAHRWLDYWGSTVLANS